MDRRHDRSHAEPPRTYAKDLKLSNAGQFPSCRDRRLKGSGAAFASEFTSYWRAPRKMTRLAWSSTCRAVSRTAARL